MAKDTWMKRVVEVCWQDACTTSRWRSRADYLKLATPAHCRTVGYILKQTKKSITVIQTQGDNEDLNASMTIPMDWVTKIKVLR
jgi:hypothetical protein